CRCSPPSPRSCSSSTCRNGSCPRSPTGRRCSRTRAASCGPRPGSAWTCAPPSRTRTASAARSAPWRSCCPRPRWPRRRSPRTSTPGPAPSWSPGARRTSASCRPSSGSAPAVATSPWSPTPSAAAARRTTSAPSTGCAPTASTWSPRRWCSSSGCTTATAPRSARSSGSSS
ncbi:MAG: Isochorismatase, partial [uncultured Actinomycetospora sp.]